MAFHCPTDDVLRQFLQGALGPDEVDALEAHLDGCGTCGPRFLELARDVHTLSGQAAQGGLLGRGSTVGRFVVLELLGRGASGSVYAAFDPQLDRRIALKVLDAWALSNGQQLELVLREARAVARVNHPNVVTLHDAGVIADVPFVAMELVAGTTLAEWLEAQPRTREAIVAAFVAAGRGLAAAHAVGVLHGDFKSDNVLVGSDGRVRVTDFGLTALESASVEADLLAFASALKRALVEGGLLEGLQAARLRAVITRGMTLTADARYRSVAEFIEALSGRTTTRWVVGAAALLCLGALWVTTRAAPPRCEVDEAALAGVWDEGRRVAVAQGFSGVGGPFAQSTGALVLKELDRWRSEWLATSVELCRLDGSTPEPGLKGRRANCLEASRRQTQVVVESLVTPTGGLVARAHNAVQSLSRPSACTNTRALLDEALPEDPRVRERWFARDADLMKARALRDVGRLKDAEQSLTSLLADARADEQWALVARAAFELGAVTGRLGSHATSVEALEEAVREGLEHHAEDAAARALVLLVYERGVALGQAETARALLPMATALVQRVQDESLAAGLLVNRALVEEAQGDLEQATALQREAVSRFERAVPSSPAHANAMLNLSRLLLMTNRADEAAPLVQHALEVFEQTRGPNHPNTGTAVDLIATIALDRGDWAEATARFSQERAIVEASQGRAHLHFALATDGLAQARRGAGALDDALALATEAVDNTLAASGETNAALVDPLLTLADVQLDLDQAPAARQAMARARRCPLPRDPHTLARLRFVEARLSADVAEQKTLLAQAAAGARRGSDLGLRIDAVLATRR